MKKRGFTLAEVMIALALIGVIASLTIPTFIANSRNKSNAAKLATSITAVENAFTTMIATEAVNDLSETSFGQSPTEANLSKYLKLSGSGSMTDYYDNESPFQDLKKAANSVPKIILVDTVFQAKNGSLIIFKQSDIPAADSHPGSIGSLRIDVNAGAKPNTWGRDAFDFLLGKDGLLYPAGGDKYKAMIPKSQAKCDSNTKNEGCTSRLIENNFEIDF